MKIRRICEWLKALKTVQTWLFCVTYTAVVLCHLYCNEVAFRNDNFKPGNQKDFFQGGSEVRKFQFSLSKLRKQTSVAKNIIGKCQISKSMGQSQTPCSSTSDAHGTVHKCASADRMIKGHECCRWLWRWQWGSRASASQSFCPGRTRALLWQWLRRQLTPEPCLGPGKSRSTDRRCTPLKYWVYF